MPSPVLRHSLLEAAQLSCSNIWLHLHLPAGPIPKSSWQRYVPAAHAGSRSHLTPTGLILVHKTEQILKIKHEEHGCCALQTTLLVLCQLPILSPNKRKQLIQGFLSKLQMTSHKAIFIAATENKMPKLRLSQCNKDSMNTGNGTCFK